MRITYAKRAIKALKGYDKPTQKRIRERINGLTLTPPVGDIKPLVGSDKMFRLRVGKYRVVFEYLKENSAMDDGIMQTVKVLHIDNIDTRGDVYK